jgi:C4-dicarboxylate-specific signal transduction histidine kinase
MDKIFQPPFDRIIPARTGADGRPGFFTTNPTGQGTGLGLSLSYDIVKAHGGELKVETKEREGSEFILKLPIA